MPKSPTTPAIQPPSPSRKDDSVKHGRRAADGSADAAAPRAGWGENEQVKKPLFDDAPQSNIDAIATVPGEGGALQNQQQQELSKPIDDEEIQREVAAAPVEYHSAMPKLSDLDTQRIPGGSSAKWNTAASKQGTADVDLSSLTAVLVGQLDDDDVPWIPDIMLVQLTSEMESEVVKADAEDAEDGEPVNLTLGGSLKAVSSSSNFAQDSAAPQQQGANKKAALAATTEGDVSRAGRRRGV